MKNLLLVHCKKLRVFYKHIVPGCPLRTPRRKQLWTYYRKVMTYYRNLPKMGWAASGRPPQQWGGRPSGARPTVVVPICSDFCNISHFVCNMSITFYVEVFVGVSQAQHVLVKQSYCFTLCPNQVVHQFSVNLIKSWIVGLPGALWIMGSVILEPEGRFGLWRPGAPES